jgi:two-component system KDP operon response regulator KdpE
VRGIKELDPQEGSLSKQAIRLLVADNSPDYRRSLRALLELTEYDVKEASSVKEAIQILESQHIDLLLSDLRLSEDWDAHDYSGLEVAKVAREMDVPCIIMTAFPSVDVVRMALRRDDREPLAEDFVPKAEGPHALLAAVRSTLQRLPTAASVANGDVVVDLQLRMAWRGGQALQLSRYQYALLAHLYQNAGVVCSPEELIKAVYNEDLPPEHASADKRLESLVVRLRRKIGDDTKEPQCLVKEPMRGYRLILDR